MTVLPFGYFALVCCKSNGRLGVREAGNCRCSGVGCMPQTATLRVSTMHSRSQPLVTQQPRGHAAGLSIGQQALRLPGAHMASGCHAESFSDCQSHAVKGVSHRELASRDIDSLFEYLLTILVSISLDNTCCYRMPRMSRWLAILRRSCPSQLEWTDDRPQTVENSDDWRAILRFERMEDCAMTQRNVIREGSG